jgi:hypothetical protein
MTPAPPARPASVIDLQRIQRHDYDGTQIRYVRGKWRVTHYTIDYWIAGIAFKSDAECILQAIDDAVAATVNIALRARQGGEG